MESVNVKTISGPQSARMARLTLFKQLRDQLHKENPTFQTSDIRNRLLSVMQTEYGIARRTALDYVKLILPNVHTVYTKLEDGSQRWQMIGMWGVEAEGIHPSPEEMKRRVEEARRKASGF